MDRRACGVFAAPPPPGLRGRVNRQAPLHPLRASVSPFAKWSLGARARHARPVPRFPRLKWGWRQDLTRSLRSLRTDRAPFLPPGPATTPMPASVLGVWTPASPRPGLGVWSLLIWSPDLVGSDDGFVGFFFSVFSPQFSFRISPWSEFRMISLSKRLGLISEAVTFINALPSYTPKRGPCSSPFLGFIPSRTPSPQMNRGVPPPRKRTAGEHCAVSLLPAAGSCWRWVLWTEGVCPPPPPQVHVPKPQSPM